MPIEFCGSMMKQSQSLNCISMEYPPEDAKLCFQNNNSSSGMLTRVISEIFKCSQDNQQRLQTILKQQAIFDMNKQYQQSSSSSDDDDDDDDDILGSSPTSTLMLEKIQSEKKQDVQSEMKRGQQEEGGSPQSAAPSLVGMRRSESMDLGQLFRVGEIEAEIEKESVIDFQARPQIGCRTHQSADEDKFMNPRITEKRCNPCSLFNVSRGQIWQMKKVVEYTQSNFPLSSFQLWQYGEENSGLAYLLHLLQQPNACIQMRCKAAQCLACLCQKASVATEFSSRMNGLKILLGLTTSTLAHSQNEPNLHQFSTNLVEALLYIVLGANMYNMQGGLLRGLRELFFVKRNEEVNFEVLNFCGDRRVVEKLAKLLQGGLSARFGEMYVGTLPLN